MSPVFQHRVSSATRSSMVVQNKKYQFLFLTSYKGNKKNKMKIKIRLNRLHISEYTAVETQASVNISTITI